MTNNKQQKKKQSIKNGGTRKRIAQSSRSRKGRSGGGGTGPGSREHPGFLLQNQRAMQDECAKSYFQSLLDPYDSPPGCLPIFPALPSLKGKCWVKGTMSSGIGSTAFISVHPQIANDTTIANSRSVIWSNSNWAPARSPTIAERTLSTAGIDTANFNSPFTYSQFNTGSGAVEWRPVSIGVRVRYSGTELNRGGTIYAIEEPDHMDLNNEGVAGLMAYPKCYRAHVTREWTTCNWLPKRATEVEYTALSYYKNLSFPLMIMIVAPTADPASYDFEVVMNYEAIGYQVPTRTMSYAADETVKSGLAALNSGPVQGLIDGFLSTYTGHDMSRTAGRLLGYATRASSALFARSAAQRQYAIQY